MPTDKCPTCAQRRPTMTTWTRSEVESAVRQARAEGLGHAFITDESHVNNILGGKDSYYMHHENVALCKRAREILSAADPTRCATVVNGERCVRGAEHDEPERHYRASEYGPGVTPGERIGSRIAADLAAREARNASPAPSPEKGGEWVCHFCSRDWHVGHRNRAQDAGACSVIRDFDDLHCACNICGSKKAAGSDGSSDCNASTDACGIALPPEPAAPSVTCARCGNPSKVAGEPGYFNGEAFHGGIGKFCGDCAVALSKGKTEMRKHEVGPGIAALTIPRPRGEWTRGTASIRRWRS